MIDEHDISTQRACRIVGLSRSMWYYNSKKDDSHVIDKLNEMTNRLPTRGFDTYFKRIREEGYEWNKRRVLRVYRMIKLS